MSKYKSSKIPVQFNEAQRNAFHKLRNILASEDVIPMYPDNKKLFDLTTGASAYGIGAVVSQVGRPITHKDTEANYATNERELLAIVWALCKLRLFLYGVRYIS